MSGNGSKKLTTAQHGAADWVRFAWYLRWLCYGYLAYWILLGDSEEHTASLPLGGLLLFCAILNVGGAIWLRRPIPSFLLRALIVYDFATIALGLVLARAGGQAPILLLILPIALSTAAYGWGGAGGAYLASALFCLFTQREELKNGQFLPGGLSSLLLLGFATALVARLVMASEAQRRLACALRLTFSSLRQLNDMESALSQMVYAAAELVSAEKVFILLPDVTGTELVAFGTSAGVGPAAVEQTRLPLGAGIAGRVYETGRSYVTLDARADPRADQDMVRLHNAESVLAVPMKLEGRCLGVMSAVNHRSGGSFSEQDMQHLEMLAAQAGIVIEYQRIHSTLRSERTTLDAILHSIASGVVVTDASGNIVLLNPAAENLLRIHEEDAQGKRPSAMEADRQVVEVLEQVLRTGRATTEEVTLSTPANLIARVDCSPVRDDHGATLGYVAVFNDITELRRLDHLKSEFVSAVSHELRTPLTSIKAFTATLLRAEFDRETQREFLGVVNDQCDRLTRLINDLLSISKIESGTPLDLRWSRVDVKKLVERVVRAQQATTSQHQIEADLDEDLPRMDGDEDKIERVLTNLINNAVKYSPEGGKIRVTGKFSAGEIIVSVADEGIGISPEQTHAVFEKFYQIDGSHTRRAGGSGLGLFLVKHLVEAHGGAIWVESSLGQGAQFFCRFPVSRGGAASSAGNAADPSKSAQSVAG